MRRLFLTIACSVFIGCGGSTSTPTTPTPTATTPPPSVTAPAPTATPAPTPPASPAPAPPSTINLTGSWTEPSRELPDDTEGLIILTQTGTSISGTVQLGAPASGVTIVTNAINGSISGNDVTMTWTLIRRAVSGAQTIVNTGTVLFSLVATSNTAMSGTVMLSNHVACTGSESCAPPNTTTQNSRVSLARR